MGLKVNLGCGPLPLHQQHLEIMGGLDGWILVDKYVQHSRIENWDAEQLTEVPDNSVDVFYVSHLLEHLPHKNLDKDLSLWFKKMKKGGRLMINVPDLIWTAKQILQYDKTQLINSNYFTEFFGEHGLLTILYGSQIHEGEYHRSGFTEKALASLLNSVGFKDIKTKTGVDAHQMGVIIAIATKI